MGYIDYSMLDKNGAYTPGISHSDNPFGAAPAMPSFDINPGDFTDIVGGGKPTGSMSFNPRIDPSLSVSNIMAPMQKPIGDTVNELIAPSLATLKTNTDLSTAQNVSNAQSTFMKRGLTGGSTELGALTRDIPAAGQRSYAEGAAALAAAALPSAVTAQNNAVQQGISLRSMVTDEQYKSMSLEQKDQLAAADREHTLQLAMIDKKYSAQLEQAKQLWQSSENDKDRAVAQQQFDFIQNAYNREKFQQSVKAFSGLAGMGIGLASGGGLPAMAMGKSIGQSTGEGLGFMF